MAVRSCPPLHRLSPGTSLTTLLRPTRGRDAVFSLQICSGAGNGDARPSVSLRWEVLPSGTEGIGARELALLAVDAMVASTFRLPLDFVLHEHAVRATLSEVHSDAVRNEIKCVQLSDFTFENDAAHTLLHGRWRTTESVATRERDARVVVTYRHDVGKLKTQ